MPAVSPGEIARASQLEVLTQLVCELRSRRNRGNALPSAEDGIAGLSYIFNFTFSGDMLQA